MQDLFELRDAIKTEAKRLGFSHIGVTQAQPVPHYEALRQWVDQGYQAHMGYLSRADTLAKRSDPGLILENCQRMICLAMPYTGPQEPINNLPPGKGRVSAYALTADYHNLIQDKLGQLEQWIQSHSPGDVKLKSYVDTGPILERSFASAAGIGIAGKNSCLIIQGQGSYFFLAEILTNLELPVDDPFTRDLCGSCQRCIEACPTHCIQPNHTIDAARCLSYLTIEHKGEIPDDLKGQIGDWLFGCDVCQIACPHNTCTPPMTDPVGEPVLSEAIDLYDLFTYDMAGFTNKFGKTALARSKRHGILRNAAIVLGNQKMKEALPVLKQALDNESDLGIQDACRWAIQAISRAD